MPRGSKPGERRGGRQKGTPNHVTTLQREAFLATFHRLAPDIEGWIRATAEGQPTPLVVSGEPVLDSEGKPVMVKAGANPGKAAELAIRMAEFHYPKRAAVAVTGEDGGPVRIAFSLAGIVRPNGE